MKKKILTFLTLVAILASFLPCIAQGAEVTEYVVFYDSVSNRAINSTANAEDVYAEVSFTPNYSGNATIITACYDSRGALASNLIVDNTDVTAGTKKTFKTTPVSVANVETVKVFAWNDLNNMNPLLNETAVLSKSFEGVAEKFEVVFENTDEYIYRIGKYNAVNLKNLFKTKDDAKINSSIVNVKIETVSGTATGECPPDLSNWENRSIKFDGTGVCKVTISDIYSKPAELLLEVVDAENVTTLKSATERDIVLLNDVSGSFSVSGKHNFYGNGFKVTLPTTVQSSYSGGFVGYVTINDGNLDNVNIVGPVYPEQNVYRDQAMDSNDSSKVNYFYNSVIITGGDCTISNSRISGSRAGVYVKSGNNIMIENTTVSGGSYANVEVAGATTVTLKDMTTIQTPEVDTYGKGVSVVGVGVVISSAICDVYLEGELNQYNWVAQSEAESLIPPEYRSTFKTFYTNSGYSNYWHYRTGDSSTKYINYGVLFACNRDMSRFHDNHTNNVPYADKGVKLGLYDGGVYTIANGGELTDSLYIAPDYKYDGYNPVAPSFNFINTKNHDEDDPSNAADTYCVYENGSLKIGVTSTSKTIDLSEVNITKNGNVIPHKAYLNGVEISGTTVAISVATPSQTLIFEAIDTEGGYNADGTASGIAKKYTWRVPVTIATLSFPAPQWNMGGNYQIPATKNCVFVSYNTDYVEAVPIFEGIKVNYYDKAGNYITKDFSGITDTPTGDKVTANPFTYTLADGSKLTMQYVIGTAGWKKDAAAYFFNKYDNKMYIYPQGMDSNARNEVDAQDFNVQFKYTFTDPNGQSTETVTMQWYNAKESNSSIKQVQWKTFDSANGKSNPTCVTGDTLVTLADGSIKRVDEVTYKDELLVWNFYEGKYDTAPVSLIINHGYGTYKVIELIFDDGSKINFVSAHGAFCLEANEFVDINPNNVESFAGDTFLKKSENGFDRIKLIDYNIKEEYSDSYTILSSVYYNAILNDILTVAPSYIAENLFEAFEVGEGMKYDEVKMQADIEKYGLYTYEEFADYISREQFDAWNIKNMKVVAGKGYTTHEAIMEMIFTIAIPNA